MLDATFRNDLGDDGYDAYLRATGKPNRVSVRELLPTGAGSRAGLEVGDELVEYAGARVFSPPTCSSSPPRAGSARRSPSTWCAAGSR